MRPPRLLASSPTIRRPRPSLILPRPEPLSVTRQFTHEPARISSDFDFAVAAIEAGMADRVRHQLVDGQRQAPAPLQFQRQRIRRQQEVDVHAIQLAIGFIASPSFRSCSPASTSVSPSGMVRMLWTSTCW